MAQDTPNMGLRQWNLATDFFDYAQLSANWDKVDQHDHSTGKGTQIPTGGIANLAVTGPKIAANAVDATKILDGSVGTAEVADGAIATAKLADSSVTTAKLADANVTTAKLADGAASSTKIGQLDPSDATYGFISRVVAGSWGGSASIYYYRDPLGFVHFKGSLQSTAAQTLSATTTLFPLTAEYLPTSGAYVNLFALNFTTLAILPLVVRGPGPSPGYTVRPATAWSIASGDTVSFSVITPYLAGSLV